MDAPLVEPWTLRLLGEVSAQHGERPRVHGFGSRAAAALLGRLALAPQRSHPREELIELLWPGVELEAGRNRLRQALFTLRQILGPAAIEADRLSLRLAAGALVCDVHRFEHALHAGRYAEALAAYGGEFMPGFYDEWIDDERLRLLGLFERAEARRLTAVSAAPSPQLPWPAFLTRFFGRADDAARVAEALRRSRLVTLLGPGGCGKTRLAVEMAERLRAEFDLVAFVPLVACDSESQLANALAGALQLPAAGEPFAALLSALSGRRALLALDNFEQLCGHGEGLLARLLARLPQLHLLVTSRRVLGLDGECELRLGPLPLPTPDMPDGEARASPALALFLDRAEAVGGAAGALADMVELVRQLDGMPLAIELAAARCRSHSPRDLCALLRDGASQLALLQRAGPRAGIDERHASMQAVIAWSWRLLGPAEQQALAALTVFHDGFSYPAAEAVCADVPDFDLLLAELVMHSLLRVDFGAGGVTRFALSEPVREFAAQQLPADAALALRRRHRAWMQGWAAGLPASVDLGLLRAELPNLGAALAGALADDAPEDALCLALPLARLFEDVAPPADALALLAQAVERCPDPALASQGHSLVAPLLYNAGRQAEALHHADAGLAGAPPGSPWRGRALHTAARVRWRRTRSAEGLDALLDEAWALAEQGADLDLQGGVLALRAFIANVGRDHERGRALHEQALARWEQLGNAHLVNAGRYNLAVSAQAARRHEEALARLDALIAPARALADWRRLGQSLNVRGLTLAGMRRWGEAAACYRECIALGWDRMSVHELAYAFWNLPRALAHLRQPELALRLAAFIAAYWPAHFGPLSASDEGELRRLRRLAGCQLGDAARAAALWSEGARLSLAEAVQLTR